MMLMRHNKCDNSVNKYDSSSDEKDNYDASDDDSLPSLCSDLDPDDMDQQAVDDLELQLTYGKIENDDSSSRRTKRRSETLTSTSWGKPCKFWRTTSLSKEYH
jgi:hypothetical protein